MKSRRTAGSIHRARQTKPSGFGTARRLPDKRIAEFRSRIDDLLAGNYSIHGRKVPL